MRIIKLVVLFFVFLGCEKLYFHDVPENSPESNFEIFWKDFDNYYGQFDIRQINWDSVYNVYRPLINSGTSKQELFNIFNEIIQLLKDGHVNLYSPLGVASYNNLFPSDYAGNQLINPANYISFSTIKNTAIEYGTINSSNIGYINIFTFSSSQFSIDDSRYLLIDDIIEQFKDKDAIIIDVRGNGGGNSSNAITVASRFADKKYLYYKQRYKNGPGYNDFSDWVNFYIEPQGKLQFTKPVVVLMSKCTFSSAEIFVSAMSVFPNVTLIGDTTGGGTGNPVYRELPNGWSYRLSTSIGAMSNGDIIDGNGILPEIPIVPVFPVTIDSRDVMLEKAIEILTNSKKE